MFTSLSKHGLVDDLVFVSLCCEYVLLELVNKEAPLGYGRSEYIKTENPSRDRGEKRTELERHHVAAKGERCQNLTGKPWTHDDTWINRNGLLMYKN